LTTPGAAVHRDPPIITAAQDHSPRYHLCRHPDGSLVELERTDYATGYLAVDRMGHRLVALYLQHSQDCLDTGELISLGERVFLAERLEHPGIFAVVDYGDNHGRFFYATELIEGEPLGAYLERVRALPVAVGLDLALQLVRLLRYFKDHPRLLGATGPGDVYVSLTPGQSLLLRLGGLGLDRPEVALGDAQLSERWIPEAARLLVQIVRVSLLGKDGQRLPGGKLRAFIEPFKKFTALLTDPETRHSLGDFAMLEKEISRYVEQFLQVFGASLVPVSPAETALLRPQGYFDQLLVRDLFLPTWEDPEWVSPYPRMSACSNFSVEGEMRETGGLVRIEILPPERIRGGDGLEAFYKKVDHPFLKEHPNFVRVHSVRKSPNYLAMVEEPVHGFSLAHLMERKGALTVRETLEILGKLQWIMAQVEGTGVTLDDLSPWNLYFAFAEDVTGETLGELIKDTPLWEWPAFELKLRVGQTTSDLIRPLIAAWPEMERRLHATRHVMDPIPDLATARFAALAIYLLEYRTYADELSGSPEDKPLVRCPVLSELLTAAVEGDINPENANAHRQNLVRAMESRLAELSYPKGELRPEPRLLPILPEESDEVKKSPSKVAPRPWTKALFRPRRTPVAGSGAKVPAGGGALAEAATLAAQRVPARMTRWMHAALLSLITLLLSLAAWYVGSWLARMSFAPPSVLSLPAMLQTARLPETGHLQKLSLD